MGLLDYYKQFEGMTDLEVSAELRARADERRRRALARIEPLDLSVTTWHEYPHPDIVAAITFAGRRGINRPVDPSAIELRTELGRRNGLEPERVVAGNGASDLLRGAALTLLSDGNELVTPWPSYPLYPLMARDAGARAVPVAGFDPDRLLAALTEHTRVLVLCNPNDPTGELIAAPELRDLIEALPETVTVLLDEALVEFADPAHGQATLGLLDDHPQLLIFRTFSKVHGLAGLRCGYALGGAGTEALLERIAPPQGLSEVVQAGALEALRKGMGIAAARADQVRRERARLLEALHELPVDATESHANVVWLRAPGLRDGELRAGLERAAVIVADGADVGAPGFVRATIQSGGATDRLLNALQGVLRA